MVEPWNSLPDFVKRVESLNCFKNALDSMQGRKRNSAVIEEEQEVGRDALIMY